ncbi:MULTISPECIES: hypothetical protein [Amylolactobacillus]|uniref:Uncharacterized protein n=1 Tax=Amylolactobacillus amylophilus DSM 20533 = JCM 1125 TaxID=1423721 RepID=A0A1L6XD46_9LACO|nr:MULTISPECIES: hypothetical protein [Amylolactobacillus]APT18897.1 hypothetical protein LA20533_06390 [Amylolactobacillus amylophilus DSM 20533 = JCM 1125]GED80070.1 hypothetical protein LAM01_05430 [Amylolactobacillus amylophilus]
MNQVTWPFGIYIIFIAIAVVFRPLIIDNTEKSYLEMGGKEDFVTLRRDELSAVSDKLPKVILFIFNWSTVVALVLLFPLIGALLANLDSAYVIYPFISGYFAFLFLFKIFYTFFKNKLAHKYNYKTILAESIWINLLSAFICYATGSIIFSLYNYIIW